MNSVVMIAREFFTKAGYTVHTVVVIVDGEFIGKSEISNGSQSQCHYTGMNILVNKGLAPDWNQHDNGSHISPWRYFEERGIKFYNEHIKVMRKCDL